MLSAFWFGTAFLWLMLLTIYMPAHVVGFMGAAHKGTYLGLLGAIGAAIALVVPPLVGAHSDKTGRRLPYLRLGVGINVAGLAVMGAAVGLLAGSTGFWVYVLGFVLVQFGNNYATAPYSALIPQLVPPEQRGRYSGAMGTLQALGQLLGAAAGVAIGSHYGASLPFVLMAALLLVAAVITIRGWWSRPKRWPPPRRVRCSPGASCSPTRRSNGCLSRGCCSHSGSTACSRFCSSTQATCCGKKTR